MVASQRWQSLFPGVFKLAVSGLLIGCCGVSAAGNLIVTVERLKESGGHVRVALFNDPKTFPKTVLIGQKAEARVPSVTLIFNDLQPGRYAVSAFQDLNLNDKLDTNAFGMPREPYGFSQGARGRFGPPSFGDASFEFDGKDQNIHIRVE
jgi:uncharacterized protein (DUF2141 family)